MQLKLFHKIEATDWARLAAYIDGEGSIFIRHRKPTARDVQRKTKRGHQLVVEICNSDPRLIVWCKELFGGCAYRARPDSESVGKKFKRPRRAIFQWIIGQNKAASVLEGCMPYFLLKKEQAEIAIAFQQTVSHRHGKCGIPIALHDRREGFRLELQRLKHISFDPNLKPN